MATRVFEDITESPNDPLWLAVRDLTPDELVHAAYGSSPAVVSRIEGVLSMGARAMLQEMRARPRNFSGDATEAARVKFLRHINFYESGALGRPLGKFLCRFYSAKLLSRFYMLDYWLRNRVTSLLRQFWLLKDRLETTAR